MSRWYIIHAYSGFENKVRDAILSEANRLALTPLVEAVESPGRALLHRAGAVDGVRDDVHAVPAAQTCGARRQLRSGTAMAPGESLVRSGS